VPHRDTPGPRAILRHYRQTRLAGELHGNWALAVLFRVPGAVVAALALRAGVPALALTAAGGLLSLLLPVAALTLPPDLAVWAVLALAFGFQVLDCADGDAARAGGTASARGAQIDFLTDMAHWGLLYAAIGVLADRQADAGWGLTALALVAAWGRLYARVLNDSARAFATTPVHPPRGVVEIAVAFVAGLSGLIGVLALLTPMGALPVLLLLVYSALDIGEAALRVRARPPA
jgi:phosphatidylglycerophosphate synthase